MFMTVHRNLFPSLYQIANYVFCCFRNFPLGQGQQLVVPHQQPWAAYRSMETTPIVVVGVAVVVVTLARCPPSSEISLIHWTTKSGRMNCINFCKASPLTRWRSIFSSYCAKCLIKISLPKWTGREIPSTSENWR